MTAHLCDVNVWLALTLSKHVHHEVASAWLDEIRGPRVVLFCRSTQQSLLRLLTTRAVLAAYGNDPLTNAEAWSVVDAFLDDRRIFLQADEPPGVTTQWRRLAARREASPKLWMDAYLAAFAIAGDYRMVTTDGGYTQFDGLDLELLVD